MNDNGAGGRRIGKKWHDNRELYVSPSSASSKHSGRNIEEDADYFSNSAVHGNLSDWDKLLADYYRDKKFIKSQKRKWLPPKQKR